MKQFIFQITFLSFCFSLAGSEKGAKECDDCPLWLKAEYLCWWVEKSPNPTPLVVQSSILPDAEFGQGPSGDEIVLGGNSINLGARSGGRFELGGWLYKDLGLQVGYFFLPKRSKTTGVSSYNLQGLDYYTIPYFDVITQQEDTVILSLLDEYAGLANLTLSNYMQGAQVDILTKILCQKFVRAAFLTGFCWWNFKEKLNFTTSSPGISTPSNVLQTQNRFATNNNFYGGAIGIDGKVLRNWLQIEVIGKVAFGSMSTILDIHGEMLTNELSGLGTFQTFPAGYFALPSNEGKSKQSRFSVLSEVNLNLDFHLAKHLDLELGYTFLYVTQVLWSGNTIDRRLNTSQAPAITDNPSTDLIGEAFPKRLFNRSGLWVQGLSAGLKFCY